VFSPISIRILIGTEPSRFSSPPWFSYEATDASQMVKVNYACGEMSDGGLTNKEDHGDSLGPVEKVYADFGSSEDVTLVVRYTPMVGPNLGRRELNEARLYDRWRTYWEDAQTRLAR